MTETTTNKEDGKLDNMTVRRFAKLLKSNNADTSTPITTGTVVQNDNEVYVAVDDETLVPVTDTTIDVAVGDNVTLGIADDEAYILGNNTNKSATNTNLYQTEKGLKLDIEGKASKAELTLESDKLQSSITDTANNLNNTITQTANEIRVDMKTGDDDARKVATNYLSFSSTNGLVVGDMTSSTLKGNTQIKSDGLYVRNGTKKLSYFGANEASLCQGTLVLDASGMRAGLLFSPYASVEDGDAVLAFTPQFSIGFTNKEIASQEIRITSGEVEFHVSSLKKYDSSYMDGEIYGETVLYNNTSGTTGTVTLSSSAANFKYLEIFYNCSVGGYGSVKVYSPNGKSVCLHSTAWVSGTTTAQRDFETVKISGTQITRSTMGYNQIVEGYISMKTLSPSQFKIVRVVGIK